MAVDQENLQKPVREKEANVPSYQKGSVAVTLQNTQPQTSFDLGLSMDRGNTTAGRFVPKLARLPFL